MGPKTSLDTIQNLSVITLKLHPIEILCNFFEIAFTVYHDFTLVTTYQLVHLIVGQEKNVKTKIQLNAQFGVS